MGIISVALVAQASIDRLLNLASELDAMAYASSNGLYAAGTDTDVRPMG